MKTISALLALLLLSASANALEQNMGVIEFHHLGYIAGNSNSERYDYVLIFKQHSGDALRIISDIEMKITDGPDKLWRIGSLDNCVVATIQTGYSAGQIRSYYAHSSYDASLCTVMSRNQFNVSDLVNDIHFGDRSITELCKGVARRSNNHQTASTRQGPKHRPTKCAPPGLPGISLKSGVTTNHNILGNQDEYWFCIDSISSGFNIDIEALNRNDRIKFRLQLFDADFQRVDTSSSSHGRGGNNYTVEAEYGGHRDHIYALEPGQYMLRVIISSAKPEGTFSLRYRQQHM